MISQVFAKYIVPGTLFVVSFKNIEYENAIPVFDGKNFHSLRENDFVLFVSSGKTRSHVLTKYGVGTMTFDNIYKYLKKLLCQ